MPATEEDCHQSDACTRHGKCTLGEMTCHATRQSDCGNSADCKEEGLCILRGGMCESPQAGTQEKGPSR
jgi:hypothetical protein